MREDAKAIKLFEEISEKTSAGRIRWEPTAEEDLFIASVGGQFTLAVSRKTGTDSWGNNTEEFALVLKDKDHELIRVTPGGESIPEFQMRDLFEMSRRKALGVDDKIDSFLGELGKL